MNMEDLTYSQAFRNQGGRYGKRIRPMDWQKTPLGPCENWTPALKTVMNMCLHSPIPASVVWGDHAILLYNDACIRILGRKHPEAIGSSAFQTWPELYEAVQRVLLTGEAISINDQLLFLNEHGKKEEAYFSSFHYPVHNEKKEIEGVFSTFSEQTQSVSEKRLNTTLLQLDKALAQAQSKNGVYQLASEVFQENPHDFPFSVFYQVAGNTAIRVSALNESISQEVAPDKIYLNAAAAPWPLKQAISTQTHLQLENNSEFAKKLPCGAWHEPPRKSLLFPIRCSQQNHAQSIWIIGVSPYSTQNDLFMKYFKLFTEQIANRVESIERQAASTHFIHEQCAQTIQQLEHLRNICHHDLQEPLRKIRTFTDLLQQTCKNNEQARDNLEKINEAAAHMSMLIQNVVNYSNLSTQNEPLEWVDLTSAIETAIAALHSDIIEKKATIKYNTFPRLLGIEKQLITLFENLLKNSLRFSEAPPIIAIDFHEISLARNYVARHCIELIYTDNGIGFDQRHADKVFLIFQKLHNKKLSGNGVGLATCRKIVENHQGSIEVFSKVDHGTTFRILLPTGLDNDQMAAQL
jgi:signal transduction histidine kinase